MLIGVSKYNKCNSLDNIIYWLAFYRSKYINKPSSGDKLLFKIPYPNFVKLYSYLFYLSKDCSIISLKIKKSKAYFPFY